MQVIPLYKPYMPAQLPELPTILNSGALAYGQWGRCFEKELSEYMGCPNVMAVNSFSSALTVALAALGLKADDEIIASPMSCLASNLPLVVYGVKVVWADIDPHTGTLDPESVKRNISRRTKAILHNHHCGYVGYVDEINTIAREKGLYVIDDAIEAFGSRYKGRAMGNLGADATLFSFQTVRLPNTIDGGGIAFNDHTHYERASLIRDYGVDRSRFRDRKGEISPECDISIPGIGALLSEINGYIGFMQMKDLERLLAQQKLNADQWDLFLNSEFPELTRVGHRDQLPNYWVFGVLSKKKSDMIDVIRSRGFYASGVHLPNHYYTVFQSRPELPGVNQFYNEFLAIPSGWWVSEVLK